MPQDLLDSALILEPLSFTTSKWLTSFITYNSFIGIDNAVGDGSFHIPSVIRLHVCIL